MRMIYQNWIASSLVIFVVVTGLFQVSSIAEGRQTANYSQVVIALKNLFDNNPDLRNKFSTGFASQPDTSFWKGKSIIDFYPFFEEWLHFNPRLSTTREYINKFGEFYKLPHYKGNIEIARKAIRDKRFAKWLKSFVKARGDYLSSSDSKSIVADWAREKSATIGQYVVPKNGFTSFNDFFSRQIKVGARPIYAQDDASALIAPADCDVWRNSSWLSNDSNVKVKGDDYNLVQLLGDEIIASKYKNGEALVCFLNTDNYHRFHAPIAGVVTYRKDMDGLYFGMKGFTDHFHESRRSALEIRSANGRHVAISAVGIATISSVTLNKNVGTKVNKGDEIGKFEFGGSSLVILFEPGYLKSVIFDDVSAIYKFRSTRVSMGQFLGRLE